MVLLERVEVKKIFVPKAALFGLAFGAVIGVVLALLSYVLIFMGKGNMFDSFLPANIMHSTVVYSIAAILIIPLTALVFGIGMIVVAFAYNVAGMLNSDLHLGMIDIAPMGEIQVTEKTA